MRKDSHFKEILYNEIQTREEKRDVWWRHNITWSSSPNLGFGKWRRSQISSVILTPILGFLVSHLALINNRLITPHPMMIIHPPEIAVHSPAGHQRAFQPSFSPDLVVMAAILSVRRWGVAVSPRFNMSPCAAFNSPDPSSDSETEGYQDGYDDSDDASESAYGDTPVPGPSGAGPAEPTRSHDARFFMSSKMADAVCSIHAPWMMIRTWTI